MAARSRAARATRDDQELLIDPGLFEALQALERLHARLEPLRGAVEEEGVAPGKDQFQPVAFCDSDKKEVQPLTQKEESLQMKAAMGATEQSVTCTRSAYVLVAVQGPFPAVSITSKSPGVV